MGYLLALTVLLAPTYALKLNIFGLPTNFLMLWLFFVLASFGVSLTTKNLWLNFFKFIGTTNKPILSLTCLFFLAGFISLDWPVSSLEKLGQFLVLFLQPMCLFFLAGFEWRRTPSSKNLFLFGGYILLGLMGAYAILQYFTLFGLPPEYWGNSVEPKRALGFFNHPNFYALFSAPLLALLLADLGKSIKQQNSGIKYLKTITWLLGTAGLMLSLSRAGWLGLGIAGLVYLFVAVDKKLSRAAAVIGLLMVLVIFSVPNLRWRFILPFYGEKSAVSRVSLWHTGVKAIKKSPYLGLGLTGFSQNWQKLNTDPNLDSHNFPHNIFLNFWIETGVLGLLSLMGLIGLLLYQGLIHRNDPYKLGMALFLIALLSQGLVDNPYFKNDLALVFWLVLSFTL